MYTDTHTHTHTLTQVHWKHHPFPERQEDNVIFILHQIKTISVTLTLFCTVPQKSPPVAYS